MPAELSPTGTSRKTLFLAFFLTVLAGAVCILLTDHRWEDWYITYRASKNLALGQGLTFTAGERVYSFTSPINTLLPALFAYLGKGEHMDEIACLGYRLCSLLALGLSAALLLRLAGRLQLDRFHKAALFVLFVGNILILDFSVNGMETAFMMLFLVLLIDSLVLWERARPAILTAAFTGLMYTRPDWFVYALPAVAAYLLLAARGQAPGSWRAVLRKLLLALLLGLLLYLPWIAFTWIYYGSPVPNTILAKANLVHYEPLSLLRHLLLLPYHLIADQTCADRVFMPAYAFLGGWHGLQHVSWLVCTGCLFGAFWPSVPALPRALSLSSAAAIYYLSFVSGQGAMPWYLPNVGLQVILLLVCLSQFAARRVHRAWALSMTTAFVLFCVTILGFGVYQLRVQQRVIEFGTRRAIGLWLHENAGARDSVFMECLGYIGFYSQLKTYDYPGMSSKEVVSLLARHRAYDRYPYSDIIQGLEPDYLVLRPMDCNIVNATAPGLLGRRYRPVALFDSRDQIPKAWYLWGRPYLDLDAVFLVFRKLPPSLEPSR